MVLHGVQDGDEDADDALRVGAVGERCRAREGGFSGCVRRGGAIGSRGGVAGCEEGARQVADRGYYYGEVVAAVPEAVVGCLVSEDLRG